MTITEFLYPLKGKSWRELVLATLYFRKRYSEQDSLTVEQLRANMKQAQVARVGKANLADVLSKSAPFVETAGKKGNGFLWRITSTGEDRVRGVLGLPERDVEIEHDVTSLEVLLSKIGDEQYKAYIEEALLCLKMGALRAAIVFLWSGAVRLIQEGVISSNLTDVNDAVTKYDKKARRIKKIDDLSHVKESTLLLVAQELGLYDKNQRSVLEDALNLRNKCGHPGKYKPGPKKASSLIEDLMSVVFD